MSASERAPVDREVIGQTLALGLDVWGTCPRGGEGLDDLIRELEGHARLILLAIEEMGPRLGDPLRATADHVVTRAHDTLASSRTGDQRYYVDDLAVAVRALLAVYEAAVPLPA